MIAQHNNTIITWLNAGQTYYLQFSGFLMRAASADVGVRRGEISEVYFNTESNHYYIFDDNPEFIRQCDLVTSTPSAALMHKHDLEAGATYTVFAYHHVSNINNSFAFGRNFDGNTPVYFDGVFYTDGTSGVNFKITKLGLSYCDGDWSELYNAWDDFENGKLDISGGSEVRYVQDDELFLSDVLGKLIPINENTTDMGYVAMMMEFEVLGEGLCYADVAYTNKENAKSQFGYNTVSRYENIETVKGVANTSQTVISDELNFTIDDNTPEDSFLPVYVTNQVNGRTLQNVWTTNASPLTTNNRWTTVQSSEFPLIYDGQAIIRSSETGEITNYVEPYDSNVWTFDTAHSKLTTQKNIPEDMRIGVYSNKTTFGQGETLNSNWLSSLKSITNDTPFNELYETKRTALTDGLNGFGITYEYNVSVYNDSSTDRDFSMVIQGNNYDVSYSVNDGGFISEPKQVSDKIKKSVEALRVVLPKGKRTKLKIRVTLMTGSNPTLHNAFVIDGTMDKELVFDEITGEEYESVFYENLNDYINK